MNRGEAFNHQAMNHALSELRLVAGNKPKAPKQVESAMHHLVLAMTAEGDEEIRQERPARHD